MFFGNLFVYYQFQDKDEIDRNTRMLVIAVLTVIAALGVIFLAALRRVENVYEDNELNRNKSVMGSSVEALKGAWQLFTTKNMILLSLTFMYTGM